MTPETPPLPLVDPATCSPLRHLFPADGPNPPIVYSVLRGRTPGQAVVDDEAEPAQAVLRSSFGFTFVSRDAAEPFVHGAVERLRRKATVVLMWTEAEAHRMTPPPSSFQVGKRYEYRRHDAQRVDMAALRQLPPETRIVRMGADLLARCTWKGEALRACGSIERFLETGVGFCLMREEDILSEAYAVFEGERAYEIGVFTARAHRGAGHAVVACAHLIEWCTSKGKGAYWSCDQANQASNRVAVKLGFTDRRPYAYHVY